MERTWTMKRALKLLAFYLAFYTCLVSIWFVFLAVFCEMLEYYVPTYQKEDSCIGNTPGLGFRPLPRDEPYSSLIWFKRGQEGNWHPFVRDIDEFLTHYVTSDKPSEHVLNCETVRDLPEKRVCIFPVERIINNNCSRAREFGYDVGTPCVLIKLNRIFGWSPEPYDYNDYPRDMPKSIQKGYDKRAVYISCDGETWADKENIGPITYYPQDGKIPSYYFPFTNLEGYVSPFIFVHFLGPQPNVLVRVECKAWAKNINHNTQLNLGSVQFELMMD